jgi:DUF1009 family protein
MTTTTPEATPLGIIAAGGVMPRRLADDVLASGRPVYVVAIREFAESQLYAGLPHRVGRRGAAGQLIAAFRAAGVRDLVMLGHAKRPSLLSLFPDAWTAAAIARVGRGYFAGGDDTLLRGVTRVLEDEGFAVRGVHELRAGLQMSNNDKVTLVAHTSVLLERSTKQSEDNVQLHMHFSRRENELRRLSGADKTAPVGRAGLCTPRTVLLCRF